MAGGWAKEGAVQEQIDSSIEEGITAARKRLPVGPSFEICQMCEAPIPAARQQAIRGVRLCVACQNEQDLQQKKGSKR
ncbi:DksA/TraR family C4-type zinc finger protein [Shewanella sp. SNU WT4]|uniref:DksA/TraR family C4-type zinc finger protein n=1 Tax=Shewanella sp. SNU WT4 TaxID=2590015 RepID=UPI001126949B|nr:DksA/TraR family C4-type zinc finger protein [Shewanella sp. SNU WT4]QDF65744.1 DksA/TraR family C4-type zinc finger protein [Shewanella sp. SNU WT4]